MKIQLDKHNRILVECMKDIHGICSKGGFMGEPITSAETRSQAEKHPGPTHTTQGDQRKHDLVLATYHLLAEGGFERLRTRDIATRADMSIATLHYYFSSKEELIHAAVEYLLEQFMTLHIPALNTHTQEPLAQLRAVEDQLREMPELFIVMHELDLRSLHDPGLHNAVQRLDQQWKSFFKSIFSNNDQQTVFRSDLDPDTVAAILVAFIKGIIFSLIISPGSVDFAQACKVLEHWLTEP